jgi:hypothetical protein
MLTSFLQTQLAKSEIYEDIQQSLSTTLATSSQLGQIMISSGESPFKNDLFSLMPSDPVSSMNSQTMQYHIPED